MEIINSKLIGTGACIPDFVLTNAMLEKMVDTNDEWIVQRTGVRERRIAKNTHTWELALGAAQDALADAGITAEELDLILVSTCSPDTNTPNTASILQDKLGARQVGAFDINNACTGFVSATDIADSYIKSGKAKTVLVVSAKRFRASWTTPTARPAFCSATVPLQPFIRRLRRNGRILSTFTAQTVRAQSICTWKPAGPRIAFRDRTVDPKARS